MIALPMSFKNWWFGRKPSDGDSTLAKARQAIRNTTLPLISPRRGRRILRREQLFTVIRESLIRGGVLSTSYSFKVLSTDANGDSFLVLIDLALGAKDLPDEYLLEIERWIQAMVSCGGRPGGALGMSWNRARRAFTVSSSLAMWSP